MASQNPPVKNIAHIFYASLVSQADTRLFQSSPTLAAGDFKVSIDGGALANLATLPTVTPAAGRMVKFSLSSGEMNGDNITIVCSDAAGLEWCDITINLQTVTNNFDSLATQASVNIVDDFVDTEIASLIASVAALNNVSVANILAGVVEGSLTLKDVLRLVLAAETGKSTGGGTTSVAFRDNADTKNRIAATVNSVGNRTAVTLDAS